MVQGRPVNILPHLVPIRLPSGRPVPSYRQRNRGPGRPKCMSQVRVSKWQSWGCSPVGWWGETASISPTVPGALPSAADLSCPLSPGTACSGGALLPPGGEAWCSLKADPKVPSAQSSLVSPGHLGKGLATCWARKAMGSSWLCLHSLCHPGPSHPFPGMSEEGDTTAL